MFTEHDMELALQRSAGFVQAGLEVPAWFECKTPHGSFRMICKGFDPSSAKMVFVWAWIRDLFAYRMVTGFIFNCGDGEAISASAYWLDGEQRYELGAIQEVRPGVGEIGSVGHLAKPVRCYTLWSSLPFPGYIISPERLRELQPLEHCCFINVTFDELGRAEVSAVANDRLVAPDPVRH